MKASEIQPGDRFEASGHVHYVVVSVITGAGSIGDGNWEKLVKVKVQYHDGGTGDRTFNYDQDVPLVRP